MNQDSKLGKISYSKLQIKNPSLNRVTKKKEITVMKEIKIEFD